MGCAGCQHTILLDQNMTVYSRRSWITAIQNGLELELDGMYCHHLQLQHNTNELISQSIFNYTNSRAELRELDGCGFNLSAGLAVTTLLTAIAIKTENMLHMETVQSAIAVRNHN